MKVLGWNTGEYFVSEMKPPFYASSRAQITLKDYCAKVWLFERGVKYN